MRRKKPTGTWIAAPLDGSGHAGCESSSHIPAEGFMVQRLAG